MNEKELQNKINALERDVRDLRKTLRNHKHYGYDNSSKIDGEISIKPGLILSMGSSYQSGITLNGGTSSEISRWNVAAGQDTDKGNPNTTKNTQMILEHQQAQAFLYGFTPPIYSGNTSVSSGNSTLGDPDKNWATDELAGAYVDILNSSNALIETKAIVSNTATGITITGTWNNTTTGSYVVFKPIYIGSANYPWRRMYLTDDIRFGVGTSGGPDVIYIKYGTGSPEGVTTANVGSLFLRTDGGANTTLYVKESGTTATGWIAK